MVLQMMIGAAFEPLVSLATLGEKFSCVLSVIIGQGARVIDEVCVLLQRRNLAQACCDELVFVFGVRVYPRGCMCVV